jgi:hypothetical protein
MQVLEHSVRTGGEQTTRLVRDPLHHVFSLNANHLARDGWLVEGKRYNWGWGDPISASVHIRVLANCLDLVYQTDDGAIQRECVQIEYSSTNFGIRRLLVCPACDKAFYNLFLRDAKFRCRKCQYLKYANSTQLEGGGGQRPEMTGYPIRTLSKTIPSGAIIWAVCDIISVPAQDCVTIARLRPTARKVAEAKETGVVPEAVGWRGGRPRMRLAEVACTCGVGDSLEGHKWTCPKGRLISQRRRNNTPLD